MTALIRVRWVLPLALIGGVASFLFTIYTSDIVSGWINFPPSKTQRDSVLFAISRAYHTHGKNAGAHVQTQPFWTDLNVEESDYKFMQTHRAPDDLRQDPDEIKSHGYFCVRVTVEVAGEAVRILHAGQRKLPSGSVQNCPIRPNSSHP